jgi:hypothetical protein
LKIMITRLALIATSAVALGGLMAAPAMAQNTPTLNSATAVGAEQVTLTGTVDTGTVADGTPCYSFEYDNLADFQGPGDTVQYTAPVCLTPGTGVMNVNATIGCFPSTSPTCDSPLSGATLYQAVLSVTYSPSSSVSNVLNSSQITFTTKPLGSLKLTSANVQVKHGVGAVSLRCASVDACQGTLQVTKRMSGRVYKCLSGALSIRAGHKAMFKGPVAGACSRGLAAAGKSGLSGVLTVSLTTDQNVFTGQNTSATGQNTSARKQVLFVSA